MYISVESCLRPEEWLIDYQSAARRTALGLPEDVAAYYTVSSLHTPIETLESLSDQELIFWLS